MSAFYDKYKWWVEERESSGKTSAVIFCHNADPEKAPDWVRWIDNPTPEQISHLRDITSAHNQTLRDMRRGGWSTILSTHTTIDVSLNVFTDKPLTEDQKNDIIHQLIKDFDGVQDPAGGTVVFHLSGPTGEPKNGKPTVQLWLHEWE